MKFKAKRGLARAAGGAPQTDAYRFRDGRTCYWCGRRVYYQRDRNDPLRATREHVIPKTEGGNGTHGNIVVACRQCNNQRGTDTDWIPHGKLNALDTQIPRRQWEFLIKIDRLPEPVRLKKGPV